MFDNFQTYIILNIKLMVIILWFTNTQRVSVEAYVYKV